MRTAGTDYIIVAVMPAMTSKRPAPSSKASSRDGTGMCPQTHRPRPPHADRGRCRRVALGSPAQHSSEATRTADPMGGRLFVLSPERSLAYSMTGTLQRHASDLMSQGMRTWLMFTPSGLATLIAGVNRRMPPMLA